MRNCRKAFYAAVILNLALVGAWIGAWTLSRRAKPASDVPGAKPLADASQDTASTSAVVEAPLSPIELSAERLQSIGVRFGTAELKQVTDDIRASGNVAIDETRLSYVQTRFSGYIVRVFADAAYKYVRKGDPLFTIYSPELASAEREYLVAKKNAQSLAQSSVPGVAAGVNSLLDASAERIKQWDVPDREVARLESSGEVSREIEIDSPVSGYVIERHALPNLTLQPDTHLYTIADLSTVWVLAQVFQNDLGRVHTGEAATLSVDSYPGRAFQGRVDFIYPDVDMTTRTARVRLVFANPGMKLTPGMFVNVELHVGLGKKLVIPANAVLQSGTRQIAFVDRGAGKLEPREVTLGGQAGDEYIVLKGLKPGERIVTSANFLVDSESQLQAAMLSFATQPGPAAQSGNSATPGAAALEFTTDPATPRKGTNLYEVKLSNSDGSPMTSAQVNVTSYMPAMPQMGMAAVNVVAALKEQSAGRYTGPVKLESGGTWQITITAIKDGAVIARKQFSVNAEGGM